jgi:hypothetical protein
MMSDPTLVEADAAGSSQEPETPAAGSTGVPEIPAGQPAFAVRCLALWLSTLTRRRLLDHDVELVEESGEGVDLVLVSTRGPAGEWGRVEQAVALGVPVIVVCHPEGEQAAVEFVRLGAHAVVVEGNEASALRIRAGETSGHLLESFAAELDHPWAKEGGPGIDPVTGLPGSISLELKLVELGRQALVPRLGLVEFGPEDRIASLGPAAGDILRRRLAALVAESAAHRGAEAYDLGRCRFGLLAASLPVAAGVALGNELVALGRSFAPAGDPLDAAVGWAGPESAADAAGARSLAERALDTARGRPQPVLDAVDLGAGATGSLELSTALRLADAVDALDPRGEHSARVTTFVSDLAQVLGLDDIDATRVALAARLHAVGMLSYGPAAFDQRHPDHEAAGAGHPERGERYLRFPAGAEVAAIVRGHHECWDGSGFPDRLAGAAIPLGARLLAVADRYDTLAGNPPEEIARVLREEAGRTLDPAVVEAALSMLASG